MRRLRGLSVATLVVASLAVPAVAAAAPTVSVAPVGQLGPEGASATIFVTASCDAGATNPVLVVSLVQSQGKRLVQGSGGMGSTFGPGAIECDGTPKLVPILVRVNTAPLRKGKVAITASVYESGPTGSLSATVGPLEARLKKRSSA